MTAKRKQKPFSGAKPEFCSAAEEEKSLWKKRKERIALSGYDMGRTAEDTDL